jgi:hypothetical protein
VSAGRSIPSIPVHEGRQCSPLCSRQKRQARAQLRDAKQQQAEAEQEAQYHRQQAQRDAQQAQRDAQQAQRDAQRDRIHAQRDRQQAQRDQQQARRNQQQARRDEQQARRNEQRAQCDWQRAQRLQYQQVRATNISMFYLHLCYLRIRSSRQSSLSISHSPSRTPFNARQCVLDLTSTAISILIDCVLGASSNPEWSIQLRLKHVRPAAWGSIHF